MGWVHKIAASNRIFFDRIQTPDFSDRPFLFWRVCVSGALEEAFRRCLFEYMYDPPHTIHVCFAAYRLLPLLTDHFCSCVWMCQGQVKRPLGDAYLNTCHNLFFLGRIHFFWSATHDPCLFCRIFIDLAWECVTGRWRGLQAMHIWIHVTIYFFWAAYRLLSFLTDQFFSCVCMCHGQWNRRSGDAYLNTCIIHGA